MILLKRGHFPTKQWESKTFPPLGCFFSFGKTYFSYRALRSDLWPDFGPKISGFFGNFRKIPPKNIFIKGAPRVAEIRKCKKPPKMFFFCKIAVFGKTAQNGENRQNGGFSGFAQVPRIGLKNLQFFNFIADL